MACRCVSCGGERDPDGVNVYGSAMPICDDCAFELIAKIRDAGGPE